MVRASAWAGIRQGPQLSWGAALFDSLSLVGQPHLTLCKALEGTLPRAPATMWAPPQVASGQGHRCTPLTSHPTPLPPPNRPNHRNSLPATRACLFLGPMPLLVSPSAVVPHCRERPSQWPPAQQGSCPCDWPQKIPANPCPCSCRPCSCSSSAWPFGAQLQPQGPCRASAWAAASLTAGKRSQKARPRPEDH